MVGSSVTLPLGATYLPSLNSIEGLGDNAAIAIAEAAKDGPFLSKDDFRQRTKVSKTVIELMNRRTLEEFEVRVLFV